MIATTVSRIAAALGLGLALASAQVAPTLSVTPNPAPADKSFLLYLWGVGGTCYTTFTRESVTVSGNRIDLRYTAVNNGGPIIARDPAEPMPIDPVCPVYADANASGAPASILPNTPTYNMPALKAGKYEVWATNMPECLYAKPACAIKVAPQSAGILEVTGDAPAMTYTIDPTTVAAGKDFDLNLLSYGFNCGTTFDNLAVNVTGNVITLQFLDHEKTGIMCPAIYKPYGPTYKMTALKAGTYTVKASRLPACYPCKMAAILADAGTLTVTGTVTHKSWYLKDHAVLAGKGFDMQLLRDDVGNCQTTFSHQSVSVSNNNIYATFLLESHPERVCIQDVHPYGPTFPMQALKVGTYPVYPIQLAKCEVEPPYCAIDRIAPVATDTLVVMQTLAIRMSELRAGSTKVEMRGNTASFVLPAGPNGLWHAELVTLDGRVLGETVMNGGAGLRVSIPVGRAPANAVSLLRLTAPDGAQRFIPVVR